VPDNSVFAVAMSRLNKYELRKLEEAWSIDGDPYVVIRRKTRAVARLLDISEAQAEKLVLSRLNTFIDLS
jgi:hypothetical protein